MKARCDVQQLFALGRTKYINNVSSVRNEESSIELLGLEITQMEIWRLGSAILQNKFLVRNEVLTEIGSGSVDFLQLHHSHRFLVVFASVVSSGSALFLTVRVHVVCMFLCAHYSSRGVPASPRPAVLLSLPNMRERSVIKSRLRSAAVRLPHRRPEHASAELRTLRRILQIAAGCYFII